ncbi:TPA: hypothetical protein QB172_000137 [Pasteurella multocida]|nr:hypothetical protein [Pasteurella multocida]HDR1386367.1 hypothetical protein [Pasteurella multocida]
MKKKILLFITICLCGFLGFIVSEVKHEIERIEQHRAISYVNDEISSEEIEKAAKEYSELYGDTPRNMTKDEFEYAQSYALATQEKINQRGE